MGTSESTKARGKLRAILDENKRAAHDATVELGTLFNAKIAKIRGEAHDDVNDAKEDLTAITTKMYEDMADVQLENSYKNEANAKAIADYKASMSSAIAATEEDFTGRLSCLANTVAANHQAVERDFEVLTGVMRDAKAAGEADRARIRQQNEVMNTDMKKAIATAISIGETKAKAVAQRAQENLAAEKKAMLIEITETVEAMADKAFQTSQGDHGKIADNYLSSLGDLLTNVAGLSDVVVTAHEGLSPTGTLKKIFTGGEIEVDGTVSKVNGLVNEYIKVCNGVRQRWPMGLGKYLLNKLEQ